MDKLNALKAAMKSAPTADGLTNFHNFNYGVYQRGMVLPAGVVCVGAKHFTRNVFALVRGTLALYDSDTDEVQVVEAPWCQVGDTGKHRVLYAITECICMNLLNTIATTPEEAEELLVDCSEGLALTEDRKERYDLRYNRGSNISGITSDGCSGDGGQRVNGEVTGQRSDCHIQGATGAQQG